MNREEAIKVLRTESVEIGGNAVSVCRFWEALDMAAKALDAVPVVRCRECKHMIPQSHTRYCTVWNAVNGMGDEGFCNYGERKEGADNG